MSLFPLILGICRWKLQGRQCHQGPCRPSLASFWSWDKTNKRETLQCFSFETTKLCWAFPRGRAGLFWLSHVIDCRGDLGALLPWPAPHDCALG